MQFQLTKLVNRVVKTLILTATIAVLILPAAVYAQQESIPIPQGDSLESVLTRIHDIQGATHNSQLKDQKVTGVPGVVTAVRNNGFYLQDPKPDNDLTTSEGIFVFTRGKPTVVVGDAVLVNGIVKEFIPGGAPTGNLSITQVDASGGDAEITFQSGGNTLPEPIVIGQGGLIPPQKVIDDDDLTIFDPTNDGIDFYESLEGMLVQVNDAVVVGPTKNGEITILGDQGTNAVTLAKQGGIVIEADDFNPERIFIDDAIIFQEPQVNVGDKFSSPIVGVLDYSFGNFKLLNTQALPEVIDSKLAQESTDLVSATNQLTVASFNVENLDPGDGDRFSKLANNIANNLKSPDIIGLTEIQDNNGPKDDQLVDADATFDLLIKGIRDAGGPTYKSVDIAPVDDQDGGQPGGNIRVGFLFNPNRVSLVDLPAGTATEATTVVNGPTGPNLSVNPGRIDPNNTAFRESRKPLVAEFLFNSQKVFAIANHFNSKGGDDPLFGINQPPRLKSEAQRLQQAQVVNKFVNDLLQADPEANLIVLGDLNDFEFSKPLQVLQGDVLEDLVTKIPLSDRYTFNYQGNSQVLDHILVSKHLVNEADPELDILHFNAGFADPVSDHDPLVARLTLNRVVGTVSEPEVTPPPEAETPVTLPETEPEVTLPSVATTIIFPGETGESLIAKLAAQYAPTRLLSYENARDLMYGTIDSVDNVLTGVYTGYQVKLDPNVAPRKDAYRQGINAEHVWPQSKGASGAKSDIHNLFPSRIKVNSTRSSWPFAEIADNQTTRWFRELEEINTIPTQNIDDYSEFKSGGFEPRENKAGDIARVMFYFRTIHGDLANSGFFEPQRETLCQWNTQDPVDTVELARSHAIATSAQGNENPFVLDTTLAARTYCTAD
ncbi:endonuclease [Lyngbya aestuarii]|uniref:endonuclease n=1 Tax=Lyngbya aestuarii TaxID=118322 RepID=UPI00403D6865